MKTSIIAACLVALGWQCHGGLAVAADDPAPRPALRSEILADLALWRTSGMEALTSTDEPPGVSEARRAAEARYLQWRHGPEFDRVAARIARELGEATDLAAVPR